MTPYPFFATIKVSVKRQTISYNLGKIVSKTVEPATYDRYAIFQTGGKQYQALEGKTIAIEKIEGESGDPLTFDQVLFRKDAEDKFEVGKPYLEKTVKATIVKQTKGPKLIAFRFKRRKKVRVKKGHRQEMTVIRIESI